MTNCSDSPALRLLPEAPRSGPLQQFSLLVHPVIFERIVSRDRKRRIVERLRDPADEEPDRSRMRAAVSGGP